ncbi:MAG: ATP-binding protein [Acidimicrobiia bacterium]|nr:ATP-binding protein [Acidimicrobiia bacterium]
MTTRPFHAELTLPNDEAALPMARTFLGQLTDLAGLDADDAATVVEAAAEACGNVIEHAYEPGEHGTVTLVGHVDAAGLVLGVRDQGLPFDPGATTVRRTADAGQGLSRVRAAVDSAEWINRGPEGKELRLVKRRPAAPVELDPDADALVDDDESVPLAPEQEYEIRRFHPDDALGVSRVIYRNYGNTYFHVDCYYPERIVALNDNGELASAVAVSADGEVVGHYALERPGLTRVAERGMAVVSPAHRGRDLMSRMRVFIEDEARTLGLTGVWSVAVTKHVFSQRVNETFGSDVCGIMLAGGASSQQFRGLGHEGDPPERTTWVVYFTYVQPPENALVHAPARHRAIIERIYAGLELPVEWHDELRDPVGEGQLDVSYHRGLDTGTIKVHQVGEDTVAEVRRSTRDLFAVTGAEVVYLELPLADPSTPLLLDEIEEVGYFLSGVGPSFAQDGDALLLQCVPLEVDFSRIEVANPFARELLEYVRADRARVRALA